MEENNKLFSHVAPVLAVDDLAATLAYYHETLGFTISFTFGDPAFYAIVRRGDRVAIHFSEREDTSKDISPSTVYVFVDDVDKIYEEYTAQGLDIFTPPEDQEWGMREFEISDINGHFLIIGKVSDEKLES